MGWEKGEDLRETRVKSGKREGKVLWLEKREGGCVKGGKGRVNGVNGRVRKCYKQKKGA